MTACLRSEYVIVIMKRCTKGPPQNKVNIWRPQM